MSDENDVLERDEQDDQGGAPSVEELAADLGWRPKEEWKGSPDDWVDAAQYIKDGAAMRRKTLKTQDRDIAELKATLKDVEAMLARSEEYTAAERKKAYDRARSEFEAKLEEAVANDDARAAALAQQGLDSLEEPKDPPKKDEKKTPDLLDPATQAFLDNNPWYSDDYEMSAYADQIAPKIRARGFTGEAFFEELVRATKEKFADRGKNPKRQRAAAVEGGGRMGGGAQSNGQSYADLPPDAKAACDRFVKQGVFKDPETGKPLPADKARAKYCERYDWEQ